MVNIFNCNKDLISDEKIQEKHVQEDAQLLKYRFNDIKSRVKRLEVMKETYVDFCQRNHLQADQSGLEVSAGIKKIMVKILQASELDVSKSDSFDDYSSYILRQNSRVRNLLLLLRQLYSHIEWVSASYGQAVVPQFFDLRKQTGDIVNYDRWESFLISDMEEELRELYQLDHDWSLLLTSSGMAAYATVHNFIMRYLNAGDKVLIPVPVYHEAEALLSAIPDVTLVKPGITDPDEIVAQIDSQTRVILLTPMTNDESLRFVDIKATITAISLAVRDDQKIFVVVDGTMCGGLVRPEKVVSSNSSITLLYFESGNKYQQIEDTGMKGIVIVPEHLREAFILIRREIGSILYDQVAACLPCGISHREFVLRMRRFSDNAFYLSQKINDESALQSFCKVNYPLDQSHLDNQSARRYPREQIGGVVTLSFYDNSFHQKEKLDELIQKLINKCQEKRLPFCKGDSYGFSIPRIHVGGSKTTKPYLRLSVGNRSLAEIKVLTQNLIECLLRLKEGL